MEIRKVKKYGHEYVSHKHDRFPWHSLHIKHRKMNLNPIYPVEGDEWREKNLRRLESERKYLDLLLGFRIKDPVKDPEIKKLMDKVREQVKIPGSGFCPPVSPIEIYFRNLLPNVYREAAKLLSRDIGDALVRMTITEYFEILLVTVFMYFHDWVHMHEMIHRLTFWNRSYEENRKANKIPHEEWIEPLAEKIVSYIYLKEAGDL